MPALSLPTLSFLKDPILLEDWPLDAGWQGRGFLRSRRTNVRAPRRAVRPQASLESPADLVADRSSSVPLVMTSDMARAVAAALTKAADQAETGPAGEVAN